MEKTEVVQAQGNKRLVIQSLNAAQNGYVNDALNVQGMVSLDLTFAQEATPHPADDNPEFVVTVGPPQGTGTGNLRGLTNASAARIYPSVSGAENGVHFGADLPVKYFGFSFDEQTIIDGVQSVNRYVIWKCRAVNLPQIATATIAQGAITPREIPIELAVSPIYFTSGGTTQRRIFSVFNSLEDPDMFTQFENGLVFPTGA